MYSRMQPYVPVQVQLLAEANTAVQAHVLHQDLTQLLPEVAVVLPALVTALLLPEARVPILLLPEVAAAVVVVPDTVAEVAAVVAAVQAVAEEAVAVLVVADNKEGELV